MALQLYKIASVEVGSAGASNITFSSIPQGYTDLKLVLSGRGSTTSSAGREALLSSIRFNSTTTTYTSKWLRGNGTAAASFNGADLSGYVPASNWTANAFSNTEIYIPNYAGSSTKSYSMDNVAEENVATYDSGLGLGGGLWNGTAAITQLDFVLDYGSWVQYSTATLYGIL